MLKHLFWLRSASLAFVRGIHWWQRASNADKCFYLMTSSCILERGRDVKKHLVAWFLCPRAHHDTVWSKIHYISSSINSVLTPVMMNKTSAYLCFMNTHASIVTDQPNTSGHMTCGQGSLPELALWIFYESRPILWYSQRFRSVRITCPGLITFVIF